MESENLVFPSHRVYLEEGRNANLPALQKRTLVLLPPSSTDGTGIWTSVVLVCLTHALRQGSGSEFDSSEKALG